MPIGRFKTGESLTAARLNEIVEAINAATRVTAGPGIQARFDPGLGLLIALARGGFETGVWCVIERARDGAGNTLDPAQTYAPSGVFYDVMSPDKQFRAERMTPTYGRQVENDEAWVHPCPAGLCCFVLRNRQDDGTVRAELWVFRENVMRGLCS